MIITCAMSILGAHHDASGFLFATSISLGIRVGSEYDHLGSFRVNLITTDSFQGLGPICRA